MGRVFKPKTEATEYTPQAGDKFESIVAARCEAVDPKITCDEVALFNWGTKEPKEIARALVELLGVRKWDDPDPNKWELDPARGAGKKLLLPKVLKKEGLAYNKVHKLKVKQQLPATAVVISKLDKWFLPADQTCDISWEVEGVKPRAKKLDFDVYASNYCNATPTNINDFVDYAYADTPDVPIRQKPVSDDVAERATGDIGDWKGESEAASGVLKPRAPAKRYINAASSPYTVMLRYYEDDSQKTALLRVSSFWPRWSGTGVGRAVVADSLKIKWHLKNCPGGMQGQFLIFDKEDKIVWRQGLPEGKCANGDQEFDWSANGATLVKEDRMPYRVQIQVHTNKDTSPGLGLAGMHTEVRIFCHPDTGTFGADHEQETQVLAMNQAPWLPGQAPAEDSAKGRKLRLAKAGYHPGPVADGEAQPAYVRAIQEFQRDHQTTGANTRLVNDGTIDPDTKTAIAAQNPGRRPLFGDSSRADITAADAIKTALNDKTADLIAWVDDRHFYTMSGTDVTGLKPGFYANMDLNNYRLGMTVGDGKQAKDAAYICRPWLPLEVAIPIMKKGDALYSATVPTVTDAMRQAAGPLRVDWTFRDLPMVDKVNDALYEHDRARPRKFLTTVITALKGSQDDKDAFNCPAASGGLRGASYYRAPFGFGDDDSLAPWKGFDDSGNTVVCSVAHDDLGQEAARVFATHLGKAGVYFRPSIIAGDGYQFRSQVNFRDLPGGSTHPNWKVLRDRYDKDKLPQMHGPKIRMWRKASLRAYIPWEVNADRHWGNGYDFETAFKVYYEPCCIHVVLESTGGAPVYPPDTLFPAGTGEAAYRTLIANNVASKGLNVKTDRYQPENVITRSLAYVWPWSTHKHLGINWVPPAGTSIADYDNNHLYNTGGGVYNDTWRKFRSQVLIEAVKQIEQTSGVMRGYTMAEFRATPRYWVQKYYCDTCAVDQLLIELTATGASGVGEDCRIATCAGHLVTGAYRQYGCNKPGCTEKTAWVTANMNNSPCTRRCTGTLTMSSSAGWLSFRKTLFDTVTTEYTCGTCGNVTKAVEPANNTGTRAGQVCGKACTGTFRQISPVRTDQIGGEQDMMGLPAAAEQMGAIWFFCTYGRGVSTWGHEIAHLKQVEHGPGAGGYKPEAHDSVVATVAPLNTFDPGENGWDRVCIMGYLRTGADAADVDRGYFCGKCILKLRGWIVNTGGVNLNAPGGGELGP